MSVNSLEPDGLICFLTVGREVTEQGVVEMKGRFQEDACCKNRLGSSMCTSTFCRGTQRRFHASLPTLFRTFVGYILNFSVYV